MKRVEQNLKTGERVEVDLTPEEIADAAAKTAAEAPEIAQRTADDAERASAKLDAVIQYLVSHTPDECADMVVTLTDTQFRRAVAKALSVLARKELR